MNADNHGLQALDNQVLKKDLCTLCGACAALCPYLRVWRGRIVKMDQCTVTEGRCFDYCPRTGLDLNGMNQAIFGQEYRDPTIGTVRRVFMARSNDPDIRARAQTGGVVSTLIHTAMDKGVINKAVLTHGDMSQFPEGCVADHREDILRCAGSSYTAVPSLEAFNQGNFSEGDRIGLAGLPCQVQAIGKMRLSRIDQMTPIDNMVLVIGLFCTWALDYDPFMEYIRNRFGEVRIRKMDITPPPDAFLQV
ncbi:MAG: Coenzyme F420 hydrogenase/dehydrogenase, beta subunit C-terminal domain, partial [Deltaproteobacteria bacterium]|nr:Coenzyme F420 hydrogenase/dehydrogenase, beta subunit C-terminal domain [Deltaproteobacteria bacterium]